MAPDKRRNHHRNVTTAVPNTVEDVPVKNGRDSSPDGVANETADIGELSLGPLPDVSKKQDTIISVIVVIKAQPIDLTTY